MVIPRWNPVGSYLHLLQVKALTVVSKDFYFMKMSRSVLSLFGIDLCLHLIDQVWRLYIHRDGKIPARCGWLAQAARSHRAGGAVLHAGMVHIIGSITVGLVAGMAGQFFTLRAEINLFDWIEREVRGGEGTWLGNWSLPGMDAILESLLSGKAFISFAELDIGDVSIQTFGLAKCQTTQAVIVAVRRELFTSKVVFILAQSADVLFGDIQHRRQVFVILTAESLSGHDDLVLGINQSLGVVTLDHAARCRHFRRLVIDDIALDLVTIVALLGFLIFQELVQTFHLKLEPLFLFLLAFQLEFGLVI